MRRLLAMIGLGGGKCVRTGAPASGHQVFARIEEPLMPLQRGSKYEEPLDRALGQARLGRVTGGGSVHGIDGAIEWVSLDLRLVNLEDALEFARTKLQELGAPKGSVLKYRKDEVITTTPIG